MNKNINEIIKIMQQKHGKEISMYEQSFLEKILERRCNETGSKTVEIYGKHLEENSVEADTFISSLNITYSEFFRNPLTFDLLEQWILPKLINQKSTGSEIRIWSAGCSAGQEAYSIAMLMDKLVTNSGKPIRFRIFATDTSQSALVLAKDGIYEKDTLQNVRLKQLQHYFTQRGETYTIDSRLKDRVSFLTYDLLDKASTNPPESIYGDFDIVFCSNLLFYYKTDIQNFILKKVQKSMAAMGYLITGEAERSLVAKIDNLQMVAPPAAIFQIKRIGGSYET